MKPMGLPMGSAPTRHELHVVSCWCSQKNLRLPHNSANLARVCCWISRVLDEFFEKTMIKSLAIFCSEKCPVDCLRGMSTELLCQFPGFSRYLQTHFSSATLSAERCKHFPGLSCFIQGRSTRGCRKQRRTPTACLHQASRNTPLTKKYDEEVQNLQTTPSVATKLPEKILHGD